MDLHAVWPYREDIVRRHVSMTSLRTYAPHDHMGMSNHEQLGVIMTYNIIYIYIYIYRYYYYYYHIYIYIYIHHMCVYIYIYYT